MSVTNQFKEFHASFVARLQKQTGLSMGDYTALVLSGHDPSYKSDVFTFASKLQKRRKKKKAIKQRDIDALLEMVTEHMEFQALSGKDRVAFARNVLQKVVPSLSTTDLDTLSTGEIHKLTVSDEFRGEIKTLIDENI